MNPQLYTLRVTETCKVPVEPPGVPVPAVEKWFFTFLKEWSEEESEGEDSQQPISREDSGIQVDRTPLEDQDNANKTVPVNWTGADLTRASGGHGTCVKV